MSHELKQPLDLIQVNAEPLTRLPEPGRSPAVQRIGGTIMRAVLAQETIVNDLLDLSPACRRGRCGWTASHPRQSVDG